MFRKLTSILLGSALAVSASAAHGAPVVEVTDVLSDSLRISGDAQKGAYVSLLVTNPGYTYEQAVAGAEGAVQYFGGVRTVDEEYSFDFPVSGSFGGEFGIYVDADGIAESSKLTFYTTSYKLSGIRALNDAESKADVKLILDNSMDIFSLGDDPLYTEGDADEIAQSILDIRALQSGEAFSEDIANLEQTVANIKTALILAALNAGKPELLNQDGYIKYPSELGIDLLTDEFADYSSNLSDTGAAKVLDGMASCGFKSTDEARARFAELIHINVLLNCKTRGYGHIHGYFDKYKTAYETAGFEIPSEEDRELYLDFLETEYSDKLSDVASNFNDLIYYSQQNNNSGSSHGGGGGGGFSGGGSGIGTAPSVSGSASSDKAVSYLPESTDNNENKENQTTPAPFAGFSDVSGTHWAHDCVASLASKGIISGYPGGNFKPSSQITRAEFAQIVKKAFSVSGEGAEFADVAKDAWYYEAVSALASKGIVGGFDGKYNPDFNITREDAALIIFRCLGIEASGELSFTDSDSFSDYSKAAVATLSSLGIINGYEDGSFNPKGDITRAEAAKIIYFCTSKEG